MTITTRKTTIALESSDVHAIKATISMLKSLRTEINNDDDWELLGEGTYNSLDSLEEDLETILDNIQKYFAPVKIDNEDCEWFKEG